MWRKKPKPSSMAVRAPAVPRIGMSGMTMNDVALILIYVGSVAHDVASRCIKEDLNAPFAIEVRDLGVVSVKDCNVWVVCSPSFNFLRGVWRIIGGGVANYVCDDNVIYYMSGFIFPFKFHLVN